MFTVIPFRTSSIVNEMTLSWLSSAIVLVLLETTQTSLSSEGSVIASRA